MIWRSAVVGGNYWESAATAAQSAAAASAPSRRRHMQGAVQTVSWHLPTGCVCSAPGRGVRRARSKLSGRSAHVLDDHDEEGQLDAQGFVRVRRARDKGRRDVGRHDLEHAGLDVIVGDALDVAVLDDLLPDLERLRACEASGGEAASESSRLQAGGGGCFIFRAARAACGGAWRTDRVEDREEAGLEGVLEHLLRRRRGVRRWRRPRVWRLAAAHGSP